MCPPEVAQCVTHLLFQFLMHKLSRVLDPVHMYTDVIERLVLLPHLLLHNGLVAHIPVTPPLRVVP